MHCFVCDWVCEWVTWEQKYCLLFCLTLCFRESLYAVWGEQQMRGGLLCLGTEQSDLVTSKTSIDTISYCLLDNRTTLYLVSWLTAWQSCKWPILWRCWHSWTRRSLLSKHKAVSQYTLNTTELPPSQRRFSRNSQLSNSFVWRSVISNFTEFGQ